MSHYAIIHVDIYHNSISLGKSILYDFKAERTQREETPATESQVTISQVDLTENIVT